jgi:hypothetical protein
MEAGEVAPLQRKKIAEVADSDSDKSTAGVCPLFCGDCLARRIA